MRAPPGALRVVATVAVLGVAVHLLLPRLADVDASLSVVRALRPWPLAGAVAAQALSYWASGVMMRRIARAAGGRLSTGREVAITLAAGGVGLVAWGALGFAGAAWRWARDGGAGRAGARLCAWLPTVLNAAVVAAAAVGMAELLALGRLTRAEVLAFAASLAAIAAAGGVLAWSARHPRRAGAVALRLRRAWALVARSPLPEAARITPASPAVPPRAWRPALLDAALAMGFDLACLELLFVSARGTGGGRAPGRVRAAAAGGEDRRGPRRAGRGGRRDGGDVPRARPPRGHGGHGGARLPAALLLAPQPGRLRGDAVAGGRAAPGSLAAPSPPGASAQPSEATEAGATPERIIQSTDGLTRSQRSQRRTSLPFLRLLR